MAHFFSKLKLACHLSFRNGRTALHQEGSGRFCPIAEGALRILAGTHFWCGFGQMALLCNIGRGIAKVMSNTLMQISLTVFAVSVTYWIP